MTSLAHQLRRLALPQSDPNLLTRSEVASLLFDPKDAVSMDRSTFYALGCTGLEELMGIEPAFLEFQDTLFSRASLTLERSVQSKEVNEKLDAGISLFLARLSPYFLLKPAHKCLEWLVHRFHVQLYNADALLRCSLPFHDTNVFVRVLQLLHIRDAAARWGWLLGPQKAGVPLSRGALVAHCYSDLSFMDFICSLVTGSVQAYSGRSGSCSQLRVIFSFYASTIVSALGAVEKVSDAIISKLLPFVHKGLKSSLTDYKAATLMIVCQLAVKVTMEASLVDILAAHVAKSLLGEPVLAKEGLGCLVVLLQNQKEVSLFSSPRASVSLSSVPALASTLQAMAAAHDVAPLLRYLLPHLIHAAFTCRSGETQKDQLAVLEAVLKSVPLTNGLDRTFAPSSSSVFVCRWILDGYLRQTELSADDSSAFDRRLLPLVRLFESRYCAALDGVLAGHVTADGEKRLYHQFLSLSVSSGKHQMLGDSDTSLLLSLKHPQPSVRVSALEHLVVPVSPGDVWWNPEKLDTNTCCYLGLTCRLFSVIIRGAGEGPASGSFRDLMKLLIKVHLCEPPMLFRFLCVLWGYGSNHGDQLDVKVGAVLQTRALYVGGAVLSAQPSTMLEQLAAADSPVVPSLLCCLTSPVREVRRAALGTLSSLSGAGASPFRPITERLLKNSEEIIADPSYLSQALGVLQEESVKAKRLRSSLQQLLQSAGTPGCPSYSACSLLRALSHAVLSELLPVLDRLLEQSGPDTPSLLRSEAQLMHLVLGKYNEASAPLLAENQNCLDLFVRALRNSTQPHPDIPSCQIIALEQMTKPFFSALGGEAVQQKLLSAMLDVLLESRSPLVTDTVRSVFKGMAVDGQLVANELAPPEKPKVSVTVQQSRRSRMSQRYFYLYSGGAVSWQRVTLILELLQHKKKLKRAQTLVPVLFALLARSLDPCPADHTNMEYTKQLLLGCLLNVCHRLSPAGGAVGPDLLDEDKFSVELVVQCIRASDVPQTHHHALLLLGAAAAIFPEKVLLNIMPIFTFMGANIMRLDDAYSFRVIDQTVQMVIPALIQLSDGTSSSHVVAVVTRILHVFADALPHVPDHRRLPILSQLVTTLGPARFLWVLMLLLFKLHATQTATSTSEKDAALERDVDFWVSLCCEFKVSEQLSSLISILLFLLKLPDDKHDGETPPPIGPQREEVEELIFSLEAHSSKELRHFQFLSVSFMAQLLGSAGFIGKVAAGERCPLCFRLLEEILRYIHAVARRAEDNADKPTAKFWRVLLNKAYEVLDKVNSLLPTDTFITVMRGLMGNELASVRRKAMELLNNKLQHRTQWEDRQVTVLLQLTGDLLSIVGKSSGEVMEREAEHAINRQTALYSLKLLCRSFGSAHQEAFVPVLQRAVDIAAAPEEEKNVTGSALLCIAEVVGALKALAIPHLPRLMPAVLNTLTDRKELLTNEIYLLSAVTALQRVTETLPHFISPYLQDTTSQVRCPSSSSSSSSAATQLSTRLASLRSTLATRLPPRVLLPTVTRCYGSMLGALMSILKEHITHMEKDQLSFHQSELTSFFLCALDFRAEHCQGDLQKTSEVEGHVIDCLLSMVMKLSEVTFRPLFFKLLDWSKLGRERLLTFCRLSDVFADRLKGLFVLFAGNLVTGFVDLLRQTNGSKTDESLFDSKVKTNQLLRFVLDCLFKIFMFDTQKFVSRERGDALMSPLVDQLENTVGGDQVYQQLVTQHLVPCVGQFSVALADESQWKTLNYQILLKTRHPDSKVRFSSLLMLMELASKLKENYMVLLPETIPFLAELMEDDCEEVEQQVQKVVQEMEKILGEPLQSYF
uniref:HEAT repeat-containing protein 1 n=1 Tax=Cyclopterus lumpus TaxID=8103 RepID=A0A8C2XRT4_CYCLU